MLPRAARAEEPESPRAMLELAVIGSVRGALGPAAVAMSILPIRRWAVGVALGYSTSRSIWGAEKDPRPALFLRCDVVDEQRFRVGLGLMYSTGSYYWPAQDGASSDSYWYWHRAARVDATLGAELVHGSLSLRLEGGVGRMLDDPSNAGPPPGSPPHWFPTVQLAAATRLGQPRPDATPPAPPSRNIVRIFAAATPVVGATPGCDCAYEYHARYTLGLAADLLRQASDHWRLGIGGRLDVGWGTTARAEDEHVVIGFVPLLLAPFYRWTATGEELELVVGLGVAFGTMTVVGAATEYVEIVGLGGEAGVNYTRPLTGSVSIVVGVAGRFALAGGSQTGGHSTNARYAALPFNLGIRW
jgi:hypothetical protein